MDLIRLKKNPYIYYSDGDGWMVTPKGAFHLHSVKRYSIVRGEGADNPSFCQHCRKAPPKACLTSIYLFDIELDKSREGSLIDTSLDTDRQH